MLMNDYQNLARRTLKPGMPHLEVVDMCALGLGGESGECMDHVKKVLHHGKPMDLDYMLKELGDVLWYVAMMADALGFTLEHVAAHNNEKLRNRYPERFANAA